MGARTRLSEWMGWADLTQAEVADRIGLTQGAVSMLLRGETKTPSYKAMVAIARETALPRADGKKFPGGPVRLEDWSGKAA